MIIRRWSVVGAGKPFLHWTRRGAQNTADLHNAMWRFAAALLNIKERPLPFATVVNRRRTHAS